MSWGDLMQVADWHADILSFKAIQILMTDDKSVLAIMQESCMKIEFVLH